MISAIVVFIVTLSLVVIVHECGHFLLAKLFGIGVEEFGLGYPPRLFARKYKNTTYSINWIPIGGFVKLKRQLDDVAGPKSPDDFGVHALWQRALIVFGGIFMNFVFAWFVLVIGYSTIGLPTDLSNIPTQANISEGQLIVMQIGDNVPAANQGLRVGDNITTINTTPIETIEDLHAALNAYAVDDTVPVTVQHDNGTSEVLQITALSLPNGGVGIGAYLNATGMMHLPILTAITFSGQQVISGIGAIGVGLWDLLTTALRGGSIGDTVSGPVGIAQISSQATALGPGYALQFIALLSLNLGVFNILPIPILDGGRLLLLGIEAVRRKPVSLRTELIIVNIGFFAMVALFLVVSIHDIFKFF